MPKTISFHTGSVWSRGHNIRDERYTSKQEHIDSSLTANNVTIRDVPVRQAYDEIFGQAVEEYNAKQKRADRRIDSYYDKIKQDKRKHPVYECIVQIGDRTDTGNSAELEKQALIRYAEEWEKRNPNLRLIGAYIHADEPNGTVHLHCDFIPVAECSRGMRLQNSYDKALQQQGFKSENIHQTAQIAWQFREREALTAICRDLGIDAQHSQGIGKGREYLTPQEYQRAKDKLNEEIQAELEPLKQELQEYTDIQRNFKDINVQTKKIPFSQSVVVSSSELQEIENQAKSYRAVRRQVENIKDKEERAIQKEKELHERELILAEIEKNCQNFDEIVQSLNESQQTVKKYLSELSDKDKTIHELSEKLNNIEKKYTNLKKLATEDCHLIRDLMLAVKMLISADSDSLYRANLTETQANLVKGIINTAKELLSKRRLPQDVEDISKKHGITATILSEIKKLPTSQPMFSKEKIMSDEYNPSSDNQSRTKHHSHER